ncbi:MAG: lactoylglutathione lyase [Alphaproteobacteria bacterium]|nr:lactoylglutathione lyase [Alphaproteobacteria bacterium]
MAKAIHTMVRVLDEGKSVDFYNKAFGLGIQDRFEFDGFTLVYLKNPENDFEVELTVNHDATEAYSHGSGYGHLAVSVEDVDAEHARMSGAGIEPTPVKEFHREGALMAKFFFVADPDGYKIEVLQRHGRYT